MHKTISVAWPLKRIFAYFQNITSCHINMFKKLNEDPDFGINLIEKDFSNEYNNISYSIKLTSI